jgi:peptide/nickel transport system substrate-binding protein
MRNSLGVIVAASAALFAWGALAAPRDSVTIGMVLEPPGLDPTTGAAAAIGEITHYNIFEGLTKINADFSVTPLLAESWSLSSDLKTLTFKLRKDVHFQDGETLTSKDVKFSNARPRQIPRTKKKPSLRRSRRSTLPIPAPCHSNSNSRASTPCFIWA